MLKNTRLFMLRLFLSSVFIIFAWVSCSSGDEKSEPKPNSGNPDCELLSFRFLTSVNPKLKEEIKFTIDKLAGSADAVYLDWIDSAESDKLIATFSSNGKKVLVDGKEQESGVTSNSFSKEVVYTVVAENGDEKRYRINLVCPQVNAEIPTLHIRPASPILNKEDYVKSKLDIVAGGGISEGLWDSSKEDIEIRLRGNSTKDLPKKPYRIKFPVKYSPLGLNHAKAKSWTLLANDCDKTLLRNAAAFAMARILFNNKDGFHDSKAILFTAATMHVNVYVDGKYLGIYQMSDQVQKDAGRINLETLKQKDGADPAKIEGGYLLEVDIHASRWSEPYYFPSSKGIKITPKYPDDDDHHASQYEYMRNHLAMAESALFGSGFTGGDGWRKYWDEATATDFFIINELTGNPDGFTSIYLYKKRDSDKFFFGPVWDFDKAYNNDKRTYKPLENLMVKVGFFTMEPGYPAVNWHGRMLDDPSFKKAVKNRWNYTKDRLLNAALTTIDGDYGKMPLSVKANFIRWNIKEQALDDAMPSPSNYKQGHEGLKKYIRDRYNFLDREFNKW